MFDLYQKQLHGGEAVASAELVFTVIKVDRNLNVGARPG